MGERAARWLGSLLRIGLALGVLLLPGGLVLLAVLPLVLRRLRSGVPNHAG
jgi:hypothetical protein